MNLQTLRTHPLGRRLPLLLFVVGGLWLFNSSLFPRERELVWQTGPSRASIRAVELQIWTPSGDELLKRDQRAFGSEGAGIDVVQKAPLKPGVYDLRYVIDRARGAQETGRVRLQVAADETRYVLALGRE